MFRQRLINHMVDMSNDGFFFVFEFGIIRYQEPNPIEVLVNRGVVKFVFSDHNAKVENTWVYLSDKNKAEISIVASRIADSEGYGELLGHYSLDYNSKLIDFKPVKGLLTSQANEKLKSGVYAVTSGKWKSKIERIS